METVERDRFTDSRESQMRRVVALFDRHPEPGGRLLGGARQRMQRLSALDTGPENAWAPWVGEPAETFDSYIDSALDRHRSQRVIHLIQARFRPFSDEFGGDVQIIDRAPADLRGGPQAGDEATQRVLYLGGNIDRDKQAHAKLT